MRSDAIKRFLIAHVESKSHRRSKMFRVGLILSRSFGTSTAAKITTPLVANCKNVIEGKFHSKNKSWVLFENQTVVILEDAAQSAALASEKATKIMKDYGPIHIGTPAGEFEVMSDDDSKGWIVTPGHCENMFTYVDKRQANHGGGKMIIGLLGRAMRAKDGKNPIVIHVELAD